MLPGIIRHRQLKRSFFQNDFTRKTECSLELNMIFIHTGNCLIKTFPEKYIIRYEISFTLMMFVKFQTQLFTTVAMEGRKTYHVQ